MESRVIPPDHASARQTEMGDTFNQVLFSAIDAMEESKVPYGIMGGIAASGMGRPRSTHDIDIFVRPEDADATLEALGKHGFETEKTDRRWLYKGWKDEMMVDVIFKSSGDIYFDSEMQQHTKKIIYHGREISAVAPEDLIVIKAAVHSEIGPHHWHDALALLSHAQVDYRYLVKRARRAARRVLALLIYAQANDILVPNAAIVELAQTIFGDSFTTPQSKPETMTKVKETPAASVASQNSQAGKHYAATHAAPTHTAHGTPTDAYLVAHLQDALTKDNRTAATMVQLKLCDHGKTLAVKGEVSTESQRAAIDEVLRAHCQGIKIENQVRLTDIAPPQTEEVV
jgi:predicted nucleotidyltransferase